MIMAIILIVVLTTIMAFMLSLTQKTTKQTTNIYLKEQAILLAKSATELALLKISGYDRNATGVTTCLGTINAVYPSIAAPIFNVNVTMHYIGLNCTNGYNYIPNIHTADSNGSVLIDTTVTSAANVSTDPIRYTRRTLQKL